MTQAEIAKDLGISQATVSYVLKGRGKVSDELRQKIMEKARNGGYAPRRPSGKKLLSVVVNKMLYGSVISCERFFIGMQEEAKRHGASLAHYVWEPEKFSFESLDPDSAGYILASVSADDADLSAFKASKRPCVILSRPDLEGWADSVMMDNADGVRQAVRRYWSLGHRRIGVFAISSVLGNRAERLGAYFQTMAELDARPMPPPANWVFTPRRREYSAKDLALLAEETIAALVATPLEQRPTAFICSADAEALALLKAASEAGLRVPEDLSVCGFDDSPEASRSKPQMDSVAQPLEQMGALAVQLAVERLANPQLPPRRWRVAPELKARGSSARPPGLKERMG